MFDEFPDQRTIDRLKSLYPTSTHVVLEKMDKLYTRLKPVDSGKVVRIDDAGTYTSSGTMGPAWLRSMASIM